MEWRLDMTEAEFPMKLPMHLSMLNEWFVDSAPRGMKLYRVKEYLP